MALFGAVGAAVGLWPGFKPGTGLPVKIAVTARQVLGCVVLFLAMLVCISVGMPSNDGFVFGLCLFLLVVALLLVIPGPVFRLVAGGWLLLAAWVGSLKKDKPEASPPAQAEPHSYAEQPYAVPVKKRRLVPTWVKLCVGLVPAGWMTAAIVLVSMGRLETSGNDAGLTMVLPTLLWVGYLVFLIVSSIYNGVAKRREIRERREAFCLATGCQEAETVRYCSGLPFSEGCQCLVGIGPETLAFQRAEKLVLLPLERVMDLAMKTDEKIRNHYVSGCDGYARRISEKTTYQSMTVTYHDGGIIGSIRFDTVLYPRAQRLVDYYDRLPKGQKVMQM